MEVEKNDFEFLKELIEKCKDNVSYELECAIKEPIYKNDVDRLINYLRQTSRFEEYGSSIQLDLSFDNYRITIDNKESIREYCKTNKLNDFSIMKKSVVRNSKLLMKQYNILFRLKDEVEIDNKELETSIINEASKIFRYKDRKSYIDKEYGLFRIDITTVKQSTKKAKTLIESGCLKMLEKYELEIEFLNDKSHDLTDKKICTLFLENTFEVFEVVSNVDFIIDKDTKSKVFTEYIKLVSPSYFEKMNSRIPELLQSISTTPKRFFLSYQPITLEKKNMVKDSLNYTSILNDYTVTEKTDGERYLIYVDKNGEAYSFNNRMLLQKLNLKNEYHNSLLDVEFVRKSKYGTYINEFMVFDIYFMNGEDTRDQELVPDRIKSMKTCVKGFKGNSKFKVICKTFHYGNSIYEENKKVYDKEKYKYNIDGLIYTPAKLAVGATYNNEQSKTRNTFGGTWNQVFKWKPAEENSIDMLVSFIRPEYIVNVGKCMLCDLKVSVNVASETTVEPYKILSSKTSITKTNINSYESKIFSTVYLAMNEFEKYPKTQTNDVIYDNCIVEFVYNKNAQPQFTWEPYRVRYDKTELYKKTKNIANTANNLVVAENVKRSIQNPVTFEHLIGDIVIDPKEIIDDKYYSRKTSREKLLSRTMALFHNIGVKEHLYGLFKNKNFSLIDLACGKGGDLPKWYSSNFRTVVGFDINLDNIMNPVDGIYKRVSDTSYKLKNQKMIFLQKDVSDRWKKHNDKIEDDTLKDMYNCVWGFTNRENIVNKDVMNRYYKIMKEQFDVVSCQFAIHYMFGSAETMDNFCKNVNDVIKPGGYFIGTCLDGNKVASKLETQRAIEGVINDNIVWRIEKKYDDEHTSAYGKAIDVYMESIGKVTTEYLVSFDELEKKLNEFNIKKLTDTDLKKLNLQNSVNGFESLYSSSFQMNKELEEYSFMNSWFVFKKYDKQ
jgi:SAM-dependent methyltransferase